MVGPAPICMKCVYFNSEDKILSCVAYPKGIPAAIYMNKVDHRKPYKGDHGIQFKKKAKEKK